MFVLPLVVLLFALPPAFVIWDARRRGSRAVLPWTTGVLITSLLGLPIYLANRPLLPGETRQGGHAWDAIRWYGIAWTVLCAVIAAVSWQSAATTFQSPSAGALFLMTFVIVWVIPMGLAALLGHFVKQPGIVERGPS